MAPLPYPAWRQNLRTVSFFSLLIPSMLATIIMLPASIHYGRMQASTENARLDQSSLLKAGIKLLRVSESNTYLLDGPKRP